MNAITPPGTILLTGPDGKIILHPKPTNDHDDPLNWSTRRKALHFGIVIWYTSVTFLLLEASHVSYPGLQDHLDMTDDEIYFERSLNFGGLGLAGIVLIPLAYRYGRRPLYLMSSLGQVLAALWIANASTKYEYFLSSILSGATASVSQTLVPMTVSDLFFVHQFATMNGLFLFAQGAGAFLAPVAVGFIVDSQGWRQSFQWTAAVLAFTFLLILVLLEESTFVPAPPREQEDPSEDNLGPSEDYFFNRPVSWGSTADPVDLVDLNRTMTVPTPNVEWLPPPPKTWRKRLALITRTGRPIKARFVSPFVIVASFPAITFAAVTYGAVMAWLMVYQHITAIKLFEKPYNFDSFDIGLFGLAPFAGHTIGSVVVAALSDRWMVHLARRNGGTYHPEMRLWLAIPGAILTCAGILVFGIAIAKVGSLFTIGLGSALFGLGFSISLDVALAYITDCYHNMIGDALVGIVLVRNLLALVVGMTLVMVPWIRDMGILKTFIGIAASVVVVSMLPVSMMIWGKKARARTAVKYKHYSLAAIPPASLKKLMKAGL
ncbi:Major facilitator superfamily domain, general substrate transporter [Metarhizium album ARSEF 1941]|uniref:Major facilitator superfamily domain, general substrate transporter n=1 Tax=Metarhizium album (strain ARSEF 1941) TaxID=1081103 RepID=A0A0B2WNZ6_METAS|nr:Major facilitator superfamily domain, general substrate transporter [Metarhizium album ARSEF 1941]KHN95728.1 Major facilitator superfamily domain, general substrate transporter [Metarhizium album ARSEF 1941]